MKAIRGQGGLIGEGSTWFDEVDTQARESEARREVEYGRLGILRGKKPENRSRTEPRRTRESIRDWW